MSNALDIPAKAKRCAKTFRLAGMIVLLFGFSGAGLVYWLGTRTVDISEDDSMTGFDRSTTRQMGILYGKQGEVLEDWLDDLKQPGTQAIIIGGATVLATFVCFKFARLSDRDADGR